MYGTLLIIVDKTLYCPYLVCRILFALTSTLYLAVQTFTNLIPLGKRIDSLAA